ncbi:hypothetical protein AG1IA_01522 [Rhizoctonia solani AG-1 IA]|uniref:T6SS Phospholipase effector Tle1-like catalytic domain-containing protein n=1 Tax=Thanatephorus cucumeris (strain AG1-IA) TaxID=983506 RepID=L8X5Y4_THACA|nr:hypothetical protein AG1IA_01522 [Rhizoctonia solani AG-1 IA]
MPTVPIINLPKLATKPRTLVLCFDGTTNYFDETVCRTSHCQAGRCIYSSATIKKNKWSISPTRRRNLYTSWHPLAYHSQIADQAIALYLDKHGSCVSLLLEFFAYSETVMGGYEFLMKNYRDGDKICKVIRTRGEYCLLKLYRPVWILAWRIHRTCSGRNALQSWTSPSRQFHIEFMGVWDTVSSVGVLFPRHLPFAKSNPIVKTFRHAVSLDDAKFKDHLWHVHSPDGQCHGAKHLTTQKPKVAADTEKHLTVLVSTQTASPIASFQPLPTLTESKCEGTVDITVTEPTPPTDCKTPLITPIDQPPLWPGVETDTSSSENEQPSVPVKISWHSQEKTHIEVKGSVVGREELRALGAPDVSKVYTDIKIVKSETGFGSIVTPTGPATIKKTPTLKLWNHITTKVGRPNLRRLSSGICEYEAAMITNAEFKTHQPRSWEQTDVLEVWFAGGHSGKSYAGWRIDTTKPVLDVGGGAEKDGEDKQLSNISLRWMIRQIIASGCDIKFNDQVMNASSATKHFDMNVSISNDRVGLSSTRPMTKAQIQEMNDAQARAHDNLRNPAWCLVSTDNVERLNLFKGRQPRIPEGKIKVHRTVDYRIKNVAGYMYRARIPKEAIEWVD